MGVESLIESVVNGADPADVLCPLCESFKIDKGDLTRLYQKYARHDRDLARNVDVILDLDDEDPSGTDKLLGMLSRVGTGAIAHVKAPYVDVEGLKSHLIGWPSLFDRFMKGEAAMWPVPIYVSSSPSDKATIGLMVHKSGKLEMFEGNDEATTETIELVNDLMGLGSKMVTVYASHSETVVDKIRERGELLADLYVSPNKSHAAGYWGEDRVLFSVEIPLSAVSQESHVDWRVLKSTPFKKFKFV